MFENIRFPVSRNYEDISVGIKLFEKINSMVLKEIPKYYYIVRDDSISKSRTVKTSNDYIDAILERYLYVNQNIPEVKQYNEYNFITCATWIYTILVTYDIDELYSNYNKIFDNVKNIMMNSNSNFIWDKLNYYRKAILSMILFDKETSKEAIKQLYLSYEEKRKIGK